MGEVNWLDTPPAEGTARALTVKVRSTHVPVAARVRTAPDGAIVTFDTPEFGVAPGQACVFYDGDRVVGGGWIRGRAAA